MVLRKGVLIKLRAFGGKQIIRRFVGKKDGMVLICSDEEFRFATKEGREPLCVGFPVKDVIGAENRRIVNLQKDYYPRSKGKQTLAGVAKKPSNSKNRIPVEKGKTKSTTQRYRKELPRPV
jgi:hypothetical protein